MKRAFVGNATPIAFDYSKEAQEAGCIAPNPVLENVFGMLLCYDEVWFLRRDLCPLDLQLLPYVKFVEDRTDLTERINIAEEQFRALGNHLAIDIDQAVYERTLESFRQAAPFIRFDNHNRSRGNGAEPWTFNTDVGIAAALDFEVDIIVNTPLADALSKAFDGQVDSTYDHVHIKASEEVVSLRTMDWIGPAGAYHESIEDLRQHDRLLDFREFLSGNQTPDRDAIRLAAEVNRRADRHARDILERFLAGNGRVETIGSAAVGTVGNLALPGVGSALSGAYSLAKWRQEKSQRDRIAWSLFVLDARRQR